MINIGAKIKKLRETNNLSQRAFAESLSKSHCLICKWERGRAYPSIPILMDMCKIFNIDINYFFL